VTVYGRPWPSALVELGLGIAAVYPRWRTAMKVAFAGGSSSELAGDVTAVSC
jgi:hypothetical protein